MMEVEGRTTLLRAGIGIRILPERVTRSAIRRPARRVFW